MKKVRGGKKRYNWKEVKETRGGERSNVDEEEPEVGREEQEK